MVSVSAHDCPDVFVPWLLTARLSAEPPTSVALAPVTLVELPALSVQNSCHRKFALPPATVILNVIMAGGPPAGLGDRAPLNLAALVRAPSKHNCVAPKDLLLSPLATRVLGFGDL